MIRPAVVIGVLAVIGAASVGAMRWQQAHPRDPLAPLDEPVILPETLSVLQFADRTVVLPGAIYPYELRFPATQDRFIDAQRRSGVIGVATDVPARGRIVCAVRVIEARRDGDKVHVVVQGVARVYLVTPLSSGEWSIRLIEDSTAAKERARAAAEGLRQLALRAIVGQPAQPDSMARLKSTTNPSHLVDLVATVLSLPREAQVAVLTTEDLSARVSVARRALEALPAGGASGVHQ
jgi:ATP-dependent Lon protease